MFRARELSLVFLVSLSLGAPAWAASATPTAADAYRTLDIKPAQVLSGTTLNALVVPDAGKHLVTMTTYMTGERNREDAVRVRLDVFSGGSELVPIYTRDFAAEADGPVGDGNLQVLDLDQDGVKEIIVSWRDFSEPSITQRMGEVIVHENGEFRTGWAGALEYDATKATDDVPAARRDRYVREVDQLSTLRTRGVTLFMTKRVIAIAGERLAEPKKVQETYPLRKRTSW